MKNDEEVRQCEKNGDTCGACEPYQKEIMTAGVLCCGCGRRRPSVKYVLTERQLASPPSRDELERLESEKQLLIQAFDAVSCAEPHDFEWAVETVEKLRCDKASPTRNA